MNKRAEKAGKAMSEIDSFLIAIRDDSGERGEDEHLPGGRCAGGPAYPRAAGGVIERGRRLHPPAIALTSV